MIYIYLCIAAYGLYQCLGLQPFATALTCFGMMGQPYSHDITQGRLLPFPRKHLCSNRTLLAFAAWPLHVAEVGPDVDHPLGGSSDLSYGYCIPYIYMFNMYIERGAKGYQEFPNHVTSEVTRCVISASRLQDVVFFRLRTL